MQKVRKETQADMKIIYLYLGPLFLMLRNQTSSLSPGPELLALERLDYEK